jgi:ferredoxin
MADNVKLKFIPVAVTVSETLAPTFPTSIEAESGTKILVAARKHKIPIRFGCGACRCGTCAVSLEVSGQVSDMQADEEALLKRMKLQTDGKVRLACRAKVMSGEIVVDLNFQDTYSPADYIYADDDSSQENE